MTAPALTPAAVAERPTRRVGRWRLDATYRERLYCGRPADGTPAAGEHDVVWPELWQMIAAILDDLARVTAERDAAVAKARERG